MAQEAFLADTSANDLIRNEYLSDVVTALRRSGLLVVVGARGVGAKATACAAISDFPDYILKQANGDGSWYGYLAGLEPILLDLIGIIETTLPDLITRHEQTLKRIWPQRDNSSFRVPRDLTNTATRDERTRFYHHEYQNKLLVGLAEFMTDALTELDARVCLLIDNAEKLPPTSASLISILQRKGAIRKRILVVLVERGPSCVFSGAERMHFAPLTNLELLARLPCAPLQPLARQFILRRAGGNLEIAKALVRALQTTRADGDLTFASVLDLYLSSLTWEQRMQAAKRWLDRPTGGDLLDQRNHDTLPPGSLDLSRLAAHKCCMEAYRRGSGPLVLAYALAIDDISIRAEALVEPSEILMAIGLYDSWFAWFAPIFADARYRKLGSGDDRVNGMLINAAFVLYAMGRGDAALPFLQDFLERFPRSRFVPTVLYAQSMTYGRYQTPIDLPRAEKCALDNLEFIESRFSDHPRYTYIKVFAENAYAYIKARQGHFAEALKLCEAGIRKITDAYGPGEFNLHRSILIYNTSQVHELVGDLTLAEARLREAIGNDPYYAEYHNDLGNLLSRVSGREQEALDCYGDAIRLSPPYYEAHINRGMLRMQLESRECIMDFRRALEIKPTEWRAFRELGNAFLTFGEADLALSAYRRAMEFEPRDADLCANAGLAASEIGLGREALELAHTALEIASGHTGAHNLLACLMTADGRLEAALGHARAAAREKDPDLQQNLRSIELLVQRQDEANRK